MKTDITYSQYTEAVNVVEKLMDEVDETTPKSSPLLEKLIHASEIIEEYETFHYPLPKLSLFDYIRYYFEQFFTIKKLLSWAKKKL